MTDSDEDVSKNWILKQFRESLQALAMPAAIQVELFPKGANATSELSVDAITWAESYIVICGDETPQAIHDKIATAVDFAREVYDINRISGWDQGRLFIGKEWQILRKIAIDLLDALGWPIEKPLSR